MPSGGRGSPPYAPRPYAANHTYKHRLATTMYNNNKEDTAEYTFCSYRQQRLEFLLIPPLSRSRSLRVSVLGVPHVVLLAAPQPVVGVFKVETFAIFESPLP